MDKTLRRIIFGLIILSFTLFLAGILLFKTLLTGYYFWFFPFLILFLLLVNAGFFVYFHKSLKKTPNQFVRNFMVSTGIKILIYFVLVLSYILTSPKTAITFALTLAISYIAYTAYDLLVMLSLLKQRKEISDQADQLSN
jgi:hypothetical protein